MTVKDKLIAELETLPEALVAELLAHVHDLRKKNAQKARQTAIASESALARDWLRPEEDEAWKDL